ncbi:MAG: class I SAM-dependent methyltransferase [Paludibacter sp.]|nr:class I SAM-dependent methyltransferase [Paludibacter sp.]
MNVFRIIYKFIRHFLTAQNTKGFGVHSPFMFQFIQNVLSERHYFYVFSEIEALRSELKRNKTIVSITDYGMGINREDSVSQIANKSLKSAKYGQLLFRIIRYFNAVNVLELGTSLGITTSYLASSSSKIKCISLEGCKQIADNAETNFKKLKLTNIELVVGNIDSTLEDVLSKTHKLDFIFIDANHNSEAVIRYFEMCLSKVHNDTIIILDDIYWSNDMEKAWKIIKDHPKVTSTVDIFQIGIVFFNPHLHKKHYKLYY